MELEYYGGEGYSYAPKIGNYEVRYKKERKSFTHLQLAINFYDSLNCEKAIWNMTGFPTLLSCYIEK